MLYKIVALTPDAGYHSRLHSPITGAALQDLIIAKTRPLLTEVNSILNDSPPDEDIDQLLRHLITYGITFSSDNDTVALCHCLSEKGNLVDPTLDIDVDTSGFSLAIRVFIEGDPDSDYLLTHRGELIKKTSQRLISLTQDSTKAMLTKTYPFVPMCEHALYLADNGQQGIIACSIDFQFGPKNLRRLATEGYPKEVFLALHKGQQKALKHSLKYTDLVYRKLFGALLSSCFHLAIPLTEACPKNPDIDAENQNVNIRDFLTPDGIVPYLPTHLLLKETSATNQLAFIQLIITHMKFLRNLPGSLVLYRTDGELFLYNVPPQNIQAAKYRHKECPW